MQATNEKSHYLRVSPDAHSLMKKPENSGNEVVLCSERFSPGTMVFLFHQEPRFAFICCDLVWFVVSSFSRTSVLGSIHWDINKVIIVIVCQFGAENRSHLPTVLRATLVPVALWLRYESGQICPHCCWQFEVALSWRRRGRTHVESRAWSQSCQVFGPGIDDILFTFALLHGGQRLL